jgi:hypothetical protein
MSFLSKLRDALDMAPGGIYVFAAWVELCAFIADWIYRGRWISPPIEDLLEAAKLIAEARP